MREIKFRAWDKLTKTLNVIEEMWWNCEGISICMENINGITDEMDASNYERTERSYEIMQLTGLEDKNGKEIYEGDMVTHKDAFDNPCDIRWEEYHACFIAVDSKGCELSISHGWCEVIGNVWENPELVKEGR